MILSASLGETRCGIRNIFTFPILISYSLMSRTQKTESSDLPPGGSTMETILSQWQRERPDIDASPMAVCGVRCASERVRQSVLANLSDYDLDLAGFDVILTIRRQGRGETLSPSALSEEMMLSTSAMTNRLGRLDKRGLVERKMDPNDRRGIKVHLTDEGFALADEIVVSHVETEDRMLSALTASERTRLLSLLTKIAEPPITPRKT